MGDWRIFLSALLLILSYPPFDLGWLAWGALLPWLLSLRACPGPSRAFLQSYLVGLLFFAGTVWWVGHVTVAGAVLLVASLALYFAAWGWLAYRVIARPEGPKQSLLPTEIASSAFRPLHNDALFTLPAAWCLLEYLRSILLSGLGWNPLGHTQWNWIRLIQIADLTGVYGVSFLVMLVNAALYELFKTVRAELVEARTTPFTLRQACPEPAAPLRQANLSRAPAREGERSSRRAQGERINLHRARSLFTIAVTGLCLSVALLYGTFRLHQSRSPSTIHPPPSTPFRVALLQGNVPQSQKWDEAFRAAIWMQYVQLTQQAVREEPDLIVWPETAVPGFLQEPEIAEGLLQIARAVGWGRYEQRTRQAIREESSGLKIILPQAMVPGLLQEPAVAEGPFRTFRLASLLVGVPTEDPATRRLFNSAVLLGPGGAVREQYDKIHLVPFGEFVPLKALFGWLENVVPIGDFSPGRRFTVFDPSPFPRYPPPPPFSVLICFEDIFPGLSRAFVREGAKILFVLTNDAWFGRSAASLQHLQASVFRAVEGRVWVGRAANTGWTGFVDPWGRRLPSPGQIPRFQPGVAVAEVQASSLRSPYVRWGDRFLLVCLLLAGWAFFPSRSRI